MARRTKEEAQQTRETILMAALDMFCDKGYSRTTFDEIAKKINLTKAPFIGISETNPISSKR